METRAHKEMEMKMDNDNLDVRNINMEKRKGMEDGGSDDWEEEEEEKEEMGCWMFRSSIQPCKCPLCCCRIVNLKPETSPLTQLPADDTIEVLKKVRQYNGLYITGVLGVFHRVLALPLFMGRIFRVLIDPDGLRCIYYGMRIIGLFLALMYEKWEFEFVPTGGLGIQRTFDMVASVLILTLFFIGVGYRYVLRGRVRRLAAVQTWDS
ncbi:hypothetical protein DH2020_011236 [Rehmannia glutinosa]|uniref:Uncharacterized protein n=1 Tax=Rehmannia glutinosa TaxID=99300 RepID=A0ABR0XDG8_REHGL